MGIWSDIAAQVSEDFGNSSAVNAFKNKFPGASDATKRVSNGAFRNLSVANNLLKGKPTTGPLTSGQQTTSDLIAPVAPAIRATPGAFMSGYSKYGAFGNQNSSQNYSVRSNPDFPTVD
jgi:hypothetical protein